MGAFASRRQWRAASRAVTSQISTGERVIAEGPAAFLFTDGRMGTWVEAHLAVTDNRLVWALPKSRRAGVVQMLFDQVVRYTDREPGLVALTDRDADYATSLEAQSNPLGETNAFFRFDGYEPRISHGLRAAIELGVRSRGNALPASFPDNLL